MTMSEKHIVRLSMLLAGVPAAGLVHAEGRLYVQSPAVYAPGASYVQRVKDECAVEVKLAGQVRNQLRKHFDDVIPIKDLAEAGEEKALGLAISEIHGVGGGGWSGSKSITAQAKLQQGGKVIGVFKDRNSSRGGVLGPFQGTCAILDRAAEDLAEDIAKWLIRAMQDKSSLDSTKPDK